MSVPTGVPGADYRTWNAIGRLAHTPRPWRQPLPRYALCHGLLVGARQLTSSRDKLADRGRQGENPFALLKHDLVDSRQRCAIPVERLFQA